MRSNVRKMWTALLAVLFAAAVGFGLWFAFAPAARPASVQAAEEPSVTFTVDSSKTLYSWYPTTGLISNRFITGTIDLADGSTAQNLQAYAEKTTFNIYKQVENEGQTTYQKVSDFRPDAGVSPNSTYTRYIEAVVALDDGRTITSEKKAVMVTADEITSFEASAVGQQTTFYALETVSEERLIVQAMYKNGGMSNILEIPMAQLDEDGKPLYGGWYIVYQQEEGKTEEEDSSKYLEYGDTYFTVYYKEGNQEKDAKVNINVIEAYVNAPVTPSLSNFEYDETPHSNTFTGYDAEKMIYSLSGEGVSASLNEDNFVVSATNVGTYSVTFTVKEGYQFLNTPAGATGTVATRVDGTTYLKSVTYTWKITQASIDRVTVAGNWKDGWTFGTPDAAPSKENVVLNILYEGSSETVTKLPDDVGATVTFYFSGTANDGTSYGPSSTLPTKAGNYSWTVSLTGMNNFEDFTGTDANGGSGSFTIQKKSLTVPELNYLSFTYNKQDQAPAPKVSVTENDPYTFSVTEQKDVGDDYTAAFSLKNTNNYEWASGSSAQIDGATATYTWVIVKASVTVPTLTSKEYNGQPQKADISSDLYTAEQGNNWINAGDYNVTLTLSDSTNYKWKDGTSTQGDNDEKTTVTFIITQKKVEIIWSNTTLTYNGENQAPTATINNKIGNDDVSLSVSGAETNANTDGATYTATASLRGNAKDNYTLDGAENTTCSFTISPYQIGVEGNLSIEGWTYGEEANEPGGVTLDDDTNALLGTATATFKYEYRLRSAVDSAYTTTVPTDAGDYTVRLTISVNKNFTPYSTTDNFTIEKDELTFGDATGVLGWTWGDDTIPEHNGLIPDATYGTNEGEKVSSFTYTYYKAENDAISGVALAEKPSDAGNYILRVSVSEGDNYKAGSKDYSFTVGKGQAEVGIEIEKDNWTYLDDPQSHLISVTVIVGDKKLESSSYTVTYYTRGWNASGDWTELGTLTPNTFDDGSTSYLLPKEYSAGYYYIGVSVSESSNYDGVELGYTEGGDNAFTVEKKAISIPSITRQLTYSAGTKQAPSELIDASNNQLNGGWQWASVVKFVGYATISGSTTPDFTETAPSDYGSYYLRLKLTDTDNYVWQLSSEQLTDEDKITDAYYDVVYQITGTVYGIVVSAEGWTIGDKTLPVPSFLAKEGDSDILEAALNEGVTVTYSFYKLTSLGDTGGERVAVISFEVSASNQNYGLTGIPEKVATVSGYYRIVVNISEPENHNYAETYASDTFTVSPYVLKDGDVKWTVPTDLTYRGSEFTYDADGNGSDEISATYKNWTYKDGEYQEATSNLLLSLPEGVTEIKNWVEGGYTLTAELPHDEANVVWGDNTSKTHTIMIEKRAVDVKLQEHHETYKNDAFEPFEAKEGTDYTAAEESGVTGLISGDDLKITLTPSSDTDAGSYAWNSIAWSNDNYQVNVTNRDEKMFVIDKAPITVTINDQSSVYGNDIVDLTYTVSGDTYDDESTIFSLSTEATNTSNVGSYAIEGSVLEGEGNRGGNYEVEFVNAVVSTSEVGTYTITPRPVKIVLNDSFQSIYGTDITKSGTLITESGLRFDSGVEGSNTVFLEKDSGAKEAAKRAMTFVFTGRGSETYGATSNAGTEWTLTASLTAQTEGVLKNYTFEKAESTMTVKPRPITVEISDVSVTYGTAGTLGVNSVSYTGGGSSEAVISSDLAGGDGAEKYANVFTLALYENNSGTLGKFIAPNDYGSLNRGEYLISLTKVSENYEITFEGATYTVEAQSIGVNLVLDTSGHEGSSPVFDGLAWKYLAYGSDESGASIDKITFHVTYYHALQDVRGDELNGAPVNAGSYYAVVDTVLDEDGNYIAGGSFSVPFTIAQRKVDVEWLVDGVEASDYSLGYNGDTAYSITARYYGWTDGNQNAEPTLLDVPKPSDFRNVGSYAFTAGFKTDDEKGNYKFGDQDDKDSVTQTFSIAQALITVAIKPQTSIYGEDLAPLTYEITKGNLQGKDTADTIFTLQAQKDDRTPLQKGDDARDYKIVGSTTGEGLINSGNYKVRFVDADDEGKEYGTYTIKPRPVKIVLNDSFQSIYGTDITKSGTLITESGLLFGSGVEESNTVFLEKDSSAETTAKSLVSLVISGDGSYSATSNAGTKWTLTASLTAQTEGVLKNYTFTSDTCTMTVIPRPITVTIDDVSNRYGVARGLASELQVALDKDAVISSDMSTGDGAEPYSKVFAFKLYLNGVEVTPNENTLLNVGEYTIVGAVTTGENARGSNYDITFEGSQNYGDGTGNAGLYTVTPYEVTVNFEVVPHEGSEDPVYDGTAWTFTATAEGVDGEDVTFQVTYTASAGSQLTGGFAIDAGTYTVSVKQGEKNIVADGAVSNYIVEADQSKEFTIEKRTLTLEWVHTNVIPQEDGSGENKTKGYDSALMEFESYTQGTGMNEPTVEDGELKVTFTANGRTTYYVRVGLKDPLNYAWPENSANVSGENGKDIQISFSVNATTNNITFGLSGSAGSVVTEVRGTYGEEFKVYIAESEDESPAGYNVVVYIDSIVKGDADTDYYYRFARDEGGITADTANKLKYDLLVDDLTTAGAGTYWMQVFALTDENSEYGIGRAYVKVTIGKKTITQDEINAIGFTTKFVYNGKEQKPVAIDLPEYLKVTFSEGATNVTDGMELRATFTIVGNNCEFAPGVTGETTVTIIITPYVIDAIYWDENPSFIYNGTDQSKDVLVYFVDVNDGRAKLTATTKTEGGFLNAGDYTFEAQVPNGNYEFAVSANTTKTITMARASVSVVILDQSGEYSGKEFELQTRYNIDGLHSYDTALYKELAEKLELVIQDGAAINAKTYTITLKDGYKGLQNYEVTLQTGTLTITPKQLTFTWPTVTGGVYQGENPGVTLTGNEFEGFVDGEGYGNIESLIKIVYSGTTNAGVKYSDSKVPTEAGSYTVTVTLEEGNYTLNAGAQAYLVARADYSFTVDINGWTYNAYDATANAPSVTHETTKPDEAQLTYLYTGKTNGGTSYNSETAPTEAGSYTVRVTISGMKNYKDAEASAEFTIGRAPIEVSLTFKPQVDGGNGWVYGWVYGTTPEDIYDLVDGSNPGGGKETATYSTGSWSGSAIPTEVGEYTLTVTVAKTNNYESGSAKVEFEIVQASEDELSFTVSIEGWTYGEKPNAPSVIWGGGLTGHPDQISPVYTYAKAKADGETYSDKDFSSTVPTNAGSYVVKATFAETDHYGKLSAMCQFTIEKATALIDTSGMQKSFTYNGRAQALSGAVLNHSETTLSYSPATVTAVGSYTVTISAKESENYTAATATVTVTVSRASAGFSVRIDDWTYGETPSRYTISGGSGGSVTVTYSGTTNAGVKYSSSKVPTEAGEYTITVVMSASGNYSGGTARDSFTIHRADAGAELTLAGWAYGETPNSYILTPEFLRDEVIRAVYSDGTYFSEAVPQDVGSYTLTVTYGETDNYLGGEVSCKFSITRYDLGLSVSIEGWTYGDEPNKPVVTGADIVGLTLSYTGTANDGTTWSSNTAPEKAGSYTLTVTVTKAGSYTGESASVAFTIARRLLTLPAWNEEGVRELTEVYGGERMMRSILGFDMALMNVQSETAQFMFNGSGATSVTANIHGVYTIVVSLKDAANYGWADLNEGETLTGPVTLTWTLTERVISLLWLIILLAVLIVIALIVLIVLLKKGGKPDGTDTGKGDVRLSSVAPVGLLLVVAPFGEIIAAVALGVVLAAVVIADIAVGVRNAKRAKAAENAQEPVPAYGDEAAAEGEAYFGTEVPADDGAEVAPDEGEAYFGTEVPADDGAGVASDEDGMPE